MHIQRPTCLALIMAGICLASIVAGRALAFTGAESLGEVLFPPSAQDDRRAPPPPVARYISEEGAQFVFDRSSPTPLLKFDQSPEVLALSRSPAARGDVIYLNDTGQPVLRVTKLGGVTLFAHARPGGAPVAMEGEAASLRMLPALSPGALLQRLAQASLRASRAARKLIEFEAQEVTPGTESVFGDAANVAAEAVVRMTRRRDAERLIARFNRVLLLPGPTGAGLSQGAVVITVNANLGLAGRPSSDRILQAAVKGR
jgi:hypothetical protein